MIQGPTAIGKTDVAVDLAKHYQTEVISADSRQVYQEMKIGTARPDEIDLHGVRHHLLAHKSIKDDYNAEMFSREAADIIENLFKTKDHVILVGGSGFYIKALLDGMDEIPDVPSTFREELNHLYEKEGISVLQKEIKEKDPEYFEEIDINNPQRLIRALEVIRSTGKKFSGFRKANQKKLPYKVLNFGLRLEREKIYDRINNRVDKMIVDGLEEEAKSLHDFKNYNALQTVGYSEFFEYFEGKISLAECTEKIKTNTRRFAKRQMTWLRGISDLNWIEKESKQERVETIIKTTWPG